MITNPKDRVTTPQAAIAVASYILGVGILSLPRGVSEKVNTPDGWIDVIISGFLVMAMGYCIVKLSQRFPRKTFYEYCPEIIGKPIGYILNFIFIIHMLGIAAYVTRILAMVVHEFLLDETPIEVLVFTVMIVGLYLVVGGVNPMFRLFEFVFPFMTFVFFLIILLNVQNIELHSLRPLLGKGIKPLLAGIEPTLYSYTGLGAMFVITSVMDRPKKAVKAMAIGVAIPMVYYVVLMVVSIGVLTVPELKTLTWPTLTLAKAIEFKGSFFERFESLFLVIWIAAIFTTFVSGHYYGSLGIAQVLKKNPYWVYFFTLPIMYMIAMYPEGLNQVFMVGDYLGYSFLFVAGVVPVVLFGVAVIRGKGDG
ncbi:MAG TPA: GerAB/ArcD/ProY family transporter [Bacillales bacterium]|nr:GerAB/ArcD/ProY family transporter [Bacillales bacterium]